MESVFVHDIINFGLFSFFS